VIAVSNALSKSPRSSVTKDIGAGLASATVIAAGACSGWGAIGEAEASAMGTTATA
jgi:hypothetical protein